MVNKFLALLLASYLGGCGSHNNVTPPHPAAGETSIVDTFGVYPLTSTSLTLTVDLKEISLVHLKCTRKDGTIVLENQDASDSQKWEIYWDKARKVLWLLSTDINIIAWDLSNENVPRVKEVNSFNDIPPDVFKIMPASLKRAYGPKAHEEKDGDEESSPVR